MKTKQIQRRTSEERGEALVNPASIWSQENFQGKFVNKIENDFLEKMGKGFTTAVTVGLVALTLNCDTRKNSDNNAAIAGLLYNSKKGSVTTEVKTSNPSSSNPTVTNPISNNPTSANPVSTASESRVYSDTVIHSIPNMAQPDKIIVQVGSFGEQEEGKIKEIKIEKQDATMSTEYSSVYIVRHRNGSEDTKSQIQFDLNGAIVGGDYSSIGLKAGDTIDIAATTANFKLGSILQSPNEKAIATTVTFAPLLQAISQAKCFIICLPDYQNYLRVTNDSDFPIEFVKRDLVGNVLGVFSLPPHQAMQWKEGLVYSIVVGLRGTPGPNEVFKIGSCASPACTADLHFGNSDLGPDAWRQSMSDLIAEIGRIIAFFTGF